MNALADILAKEFEDSEYAHAYIQSHVLEKLAMQVYALRTQRGLSQSQLAKLSGIGQGKISKIETGDFESLNLKTLFKLAEAFDVAPAVRFEHFTEAIGDVAELQAESLKLSDRAHDLQVRKGVRHLFSNPMLSTVLMDAHISAPATPIPFGALPIVNQGDLDEMFALGA